MQRRGLLPRVFTLTGEKKEKLRRFFSVTPSWRLLPTVLSTGGCPALCGLSSVPEGTATDRPTILGCKVRGFCADYKIRERAASTALYS